MKADTLTTQDVMTMFGVTLMTVNNWRKGSPRIPKLPFHQEARGQRKSVYFKKVEVLEWAKKNDIKLVK